MKGDHSTLFARVGFTLIELLVTIALITVLISMMIPCWGAITRSRSRQIGTGLVMESLERARNAAITEKKDVWVVFRHQEGIHQDSLRTLYRKGSLAIPLDAWQSLPSGISFQEGGTNLMQEHPPGDLLSASLNGQSAQPGESFGAVMFQQSGRVGIPRPGGNALAIQLDSPSGPLPNSIILSRATGRATCQ